MFRRLPGFRAQAVTVIVDGAATTAMAGDCVASVLLRTPPHSARRTAPSGSLRAPFCMMGVCMECAATVNGVPSTLTCQTMVAEGMRIERQDSLPAIAGSAAHANGSGHG